MEPEQSLLEQEDRADGFLLDPWRAVLDAVIFLLLLVAIGMSVRITASPSSTSVCKTLEGPVPLQVLIQLIPLCLILAVLYSSYLARYALGSPHRVGLALFQLVLGVILGEWLGICAWGFSPGLIFVIGTMLVAVLVGLCTSNCFIGIN